MLGEVCPELKVAIVRYLPWEDRRAVALVGRDWPAVVRSSYEMDAGELGLQGDWKSASIKQWMQWKTLLDFLEASVQSLPLARQLECTINVSNGQLTLWRRHRDEGVTLDSRFSFMWEQGGAQLRVSTYTTIIEEDCEAEIKQSSICRPKDRISRHAFAVLLAPFLIDCEQVEQSLKRKREPEA